MNVLIVTRHARSPFSGTAGRIWTLGERFTRHAGTAVTTVVPDPDAAVDFPRSSDGSDGTGESGLSIWRKATAAYRFIRQRLPFFSASAVTWPTLMHREGISWADFDVVLLHQASLCHLVNDVPSDIRVICILDEDKSRFAPRRLQVLHSLKIRRLYRRVLQRSSLVVVLTTEERDAIVRYAGPEDYGKVTVHPLGLDLSVYSMTDDFERISETCDVGVFGAMTYPRRVAPVVAAVQQSRARGFEWSWVVCGPITPFWRERLEALGARCTGSVPDLRPHYLSAGVVLVPAMEVPGMKTTLLEALALGRPVVASQASTVGTDLVAGEHLLVASSIPEAVVQVERLLESPSLAEDVAATGSEYVRRAHDLERTTDRIIEDCLTALADSPRSRRRRYPS